LDSRISIFLAKVALLKEEGATREPDRAKPQEKAASSVRTAADGVII
jgi:hypothetical protein